LISARSVGHVVEIEMDYARRAYGDYNELLASVSGIFASLARDTV